MHFDSSNKPVLGMIGLPIIELKTLTGVFCLFVCLKEGGDHGWVAQVSSSSRYTKVGS